MEITVIPNEQTPKIDNVNDNIDIYINNNNVKLQSFLEYAETRKDAAGLAANQCSVDAEITINRTVKNSSDELKTIKKLLNQYCSCEKPWTVDGICIICEKPYKMD